MNLPFLVGLLVLCLGLLAALLLALRQALLALNRLQSALFADLPCQRGRGCPFQEEPGDA